MKDKFISAQSDSASAKIAGNRVHNRLVIEHLPLASLQLDPLNSRLHSPKQIRQIAASIRTFGFIVPVLIDGNRKIIAGHGRFLASELLKISEVPTICLDHLSPQQLRAFAIADNKLTENSKWHQTLLGEQLKALSVVELDFNLEVTGFEMEEITIMIEGLAPAADARQDPADTVPERIQAPVSSFGDLWQLGKNRVLCGNALARESYARLMNDQLAAAVFTDPLRSLPTETSASEYTDFLARAFRLQSDHSRSGSLHYVFTDWRHIQELLAASKLIFAEPVNLCIWSNRKAGVGAFYRSQHELIFLFQNGRDGKLNNVRRRTDVWKYPEVDTHEHSSLEVHSTIKPVALIADAIIDSTSRGDIVLDPFVGCGTSILAAERTGRACYGVESDPVNVDTIVHRWQLFTGLSATHGVSGRLFSKLEEAAGEELK